MTYEEVVALLSGWAKMGHHKFGDDVTVIGGELGVFPQKWVHTIFPPLPKNVLDEKLAHFPHLKEFDYYNALTRINGMKLFGDALYLFGCYSTYRKPQSPGMVWDIYRHNLDYYDRYAKPFGAVVLGGAHFGDTKKIYSQTKLGTIIAVDFEREEVDFEWPGLEDFLVSEIARLNGLASFDINAKSNESWQSYET